MATKQQDTRNETPKPETPKVERPRREKSLVSSWFSIGDWRTQSSKEEWALA